MTLNFAETSPGVHMAQLEDASKGTFRTIVIIESLGKFTLYVDGEVALRDLPTFEAAASQADVILTKKGSRRMVQVAAGLVLLSVIGGSAVGAVNLLSGSSPLAIASAIQSKYAAMTKTESAVASTTQTEQSTTSIVRTKSPVSTVTINAPQSEPADVAPASQQAEASPIRTIPSPSSSSGQEETQSVEISSTPASAQTAPVSNDTADQESPPAESAKTAEAPKSDRRIFSATRPVFGGVRPPEAEGSATVVTTASPVPEAPATTPDTADAQESENAPNPYATTAAAPQVETPNAPATEPANVAETEAEPAEGDAPAVVAIPLPNKNPLGGGSGTSTSTNAGQAPARVAIVPQQDAEPASQDASPAAAQSTDTAERQQPIYPITAAPRRAEKQRAFGQRKKTRRIKNAKKRRNARRHARRHARRGRVMRCMYGGCRWVKVDGYYDRQYRRHRHLYGRLTRY